MNVQKPLFWHQGLFLQPQHFQLSDVHQRSLLIPYSKFLEPYFWGVGGLKVQQSALGTRTFELLRGEFLFQDGTYAVLPENGTLEARSFEESWIEGGKPLSVFIGLKKLSESGANVTMLPALKELSSVTTRYVTTQDGEDAADLHEGGPTAQVGRLQYLLKVFWGTERELIGDYLLIEVGRLVREGEEIVLSERFIPPCLDMMASSALLALIKEVRDLISARSRQLEELKAQRGIHTAEFGARDMVFLLALRSLNRYVPLLRHITETPRVHPWAVYGALRQLIGELSSFSERVNVHGELLGGEQALPPYDHEDLWTCFSAAQRLIVQLLDEITAGPEYIIRLIYDGTYYSAELPPGLFEGHKRYYLVFRTEENPEIVFHSLENIAKLSSREALPILIARALPGLQMEHLPIPPQELPRRAHCLYFRIDHHGDQWANVQKGRNLALYWDNAPEDMEVELMVVGRA